MQPVFISYSSNHRDLTRELAAVIEAQYGAGSVWWDHALESRASYSTQIKAALEQARVVVVIWTAGAMISDYVYAEAVLAQAQGKLVNVRPADTGFRDIPEPFNIHRVDDLADHDRILATIAKVWNGTPLPTRVPLHEIWFRQHGHRLIDPKQKRLPRDPRKISPSELLQAKYAVVPYADVTGMAAELLDWCTAGPRPTAGRLLHGPGGLGKTRLLIHVAAELRDKHGWTAGFLDRPHEEVEATLKQRWQALEQLIAHGDDAGFLLVLDYAEGRQDELLRLAKTLADRPEDDTRLVRIVLLARGAGEWWESLTQEQPDLERLVRLPGGQLDAKNLPLIATARQRLDLFQASRCSFAPILVAQGFAAPSAEPTPERLQRLATNDDYERPLAVQMEALLWLASAAPAAGSTTIDQLLDRILGLERAHWQKLLGMQDADAVRDLARGVGQVTLLQGVGSRSAAEQLLMADGFYGEKRKARVDVDPVMRALGRLYGNSDGIAPIEPDLVGEHHVAADKVGDAELLTACIAWIERQPEDLRPKHRRDLVTVLQRATQPEHGVKSVGHVEAMLDLVIASHTGSFANELIAVMIETPGSLTQRLDAQIDILSEGALAALDSHLPLQSLSLMDLSLRLADRRASLARDLFFEIDQDADAGVEQRDAVSSHLAARVGTLGIRLSNLGRREEALAASQEAVEIYRQLAAARPDAFLPDLASSLNNLGAYLSNLGRREEALAASQEAVDIRRQLAAAQPDAFLPDLAMSLDNLGGDLSNLGRREEALAAGQEAVEIYRQLAAARPDAFLPDLARSLHNTGVLLSNLGRREEALAASQEAVDIRRQLAAAQPDAFLPDLARSLDNLGLRLSDLGWREKALAPSQEAVDLYRRLAAARPDALLHDVARSLHNLGICLSDLGRREEALAPSQEAVEIRRQLAAAWPDAFLPNLARSLDNLGNRLADLGCREEALAPSQEAVDLYRRLVAARPDAFLHDVARSLNNLGIRLSDLGRREEALAPSQEAVDIRRRLAAARPDAFLPDLASSLNNLGNRLSTIGRREEALAASQEAVDLYRRLAVARPDAFLHDVARSLNNLGIRVSNLGRREEALAASQEAVEIYRQLAAARPDAFLPDLASSLNNLGAYLSNLGRREEALAASQEAVDIRRQLAAAQPDAFLPDLAMSLRALSQILAALDRAADAAATAGEGLRLLAPLVERRPQAFAQSARALAGGLIRHSEAAGIQPDVALLTRIAAALGLNEPDS